MSCCPRWLATLLLAAAVLCGPRLLGVGVQPTQDSALVPDRLVADFGEVLEGREVELRFGLETTSEQPVAITRTRSCSCIDVEAPEGSIAPGATTELLVTVRTEHRSGAFRKTVDLLTDEPGRVTLVVKGWIHQPLRPEVTHLSLSDAEPGQVEEFEWDVVVDDGTKDVQLEVEGEGLEVDPLVAAGGDFTIRGRVQAPEVARTRRGAILLRCRYEGQEWTKRIWVQVTVPVPFQPVQKRIKVSRDQAATLLVRRRTRDGEITAVVPPAGIAVREKEERRTDGMVVYEVRFEDGAAALAAGSRIRFETSSPRLPFFEVEVVAGDG